VTVGDVADVADVEDVADIEDVVDTDERGDAISDVDNRDIFPKIFFVLALQLNVKRFIFYSLTCLRVSTT
jgi:hypothetical protein